MSAVSLDAVIHGRQLRAAIPFADPGETVIALSADMQILAQAALATSAFVGMEGVAALTHRYIMHGALWHVHQSHHTPRTGWFERNDLFAVAFALPAIVLFAGSSAVPWLFSIACGISAYGIAYALLHDGLVHRRIPLMRAPRTGYAARLVAAHHLHHVVHTRTGGVSFGFLYAPPLTQLRRRLRSAERRTVTRPTVTPPATQRG